MPKNQPLLFALEGNAGLEMRVAGELGWPLSPVEERAFERGEHKARPLTEVERREVYVLQGLNVDGDASANDKLMRLLLFLAALKDNGGAKVTAVQPYLCHARKDRRTKPRDPVNTRTVARLFGADGNERILALDVHNAAEFENAFRIRADELTATPLLVAHFAARLSGEKACASAGLLPALPAAVTVSPLPAAPPSNASAEQFKPVCQLCRCPSARRSIREQRLPFRPQNVDRSQPSHADRRVWSVL